MLFQPNGLILQGRAPNFHAKQMAQQAVMELAPMPILANDIEVGSPSLAIENHSCLGDFSLNRKRCLRSSLACGPASLQ